MRSWDSQTTQLIQNHTIDIKAYNQDSIIKSSFWFPFFPFIIPLSMDIITYHNFAP